MELHFRFGLKEQQQLAQNFIHLDFMHHQVFIWKQNLQKLQLMIH